MPQRTIYVPDEIWRPLRAKYALEGIAVSAWVRRQATEYVNNGADSHDGDPSSEAASEEREAKESNGCH